MTEIYRPKPHRMDPMREMCFRENWQDRMAQTKTVVEVRHSGTWDTCESWALTKPQQETWEIVVAHYEMKRKLGALLQGKYTITIPGTDRRHSFEVE